MGPLQLLLVGFPEPRFSGNVLRELRTIHDAGLIRIVDAQAVMKDGSGKVNTVEFSDLSEEQRVRLGAVIGGLIGLGAGGREGARAGTEVGAMRAAEHDYGMSREETRELLDLMPNNSAAVLALIEHRWAERLKDAVKQAGGRLIAQGMLSPEALVGLGEAMAATSEVFEAEKMAAR